MTYFLNGLEGSRMSSTRTPTYSICICNYNMADTIELSLNSLINQLDECFEIVIVDDGSSDSSVNIIKKVQKRFKNLKLISLERDRNRKLGFTRNISIQEAVGEYVLLHLDCDDVFGPFIADFVKVFHRIEQAIGHDILLSGQHINMARKRFLLSHGPYINIYRGEDRHFWSRVAATGAYVPLDHIDFITRMPKNRRRRLRKNVIDTFDHMRNDFRFGVSLRKYFSYEIKNRSLFSKKLFAFRVAMLIPSWIAASFDQPISQEGCIGNHEVFAAYREKNRGTYKEIMERYGHSPEIDFLNSDAQQIFSDKEVV